MLKQLRNLNLPLLTKELQEQSARPRTFLLRATYGFLLYVGVAALNAQYFYGISSGVTSTDSLLGIGRDIFRSIVWLQFAGIYLFLPAMVSGVLTVEKERNTFGLLLITKLSPWEIILEKYFSRIIPMLTFLLISLPLIGFSYSLGGLESTTVCLALWFLLLSVLQVASISILASAFFPGSIPAFLGTYVLLALIAGGPAAIDTLFFDHHLRSAFNVLANVILAPLIGVARPGVDDRLVSQLLGYSLQWPPLLFELNESVFSNWAFLKAQMRASTTTSQAMGFFGRSDWGNVGFSLLCGIPLLICSVTSLALARFFLIRRAFVTSTNPLLSVFKWLDRMFHQANQRWTGGVVLIQESSQLPESKPVEWRETSKKTLGQFRYLVRILVALELPTLLFAWLVVTSPTEPYVGSSMITIWYFILCFITSVLICITASTLIVAERSRQTLDVLFTTPLSNREIIQQKLSGVWRLIGVCSVPLLTCICVQTWWRIEAERVRIASRIPGQIESFADPYSWVEYFITSTVTIFLLLRLQAWTSFWIGLRTKSMAKAILLALIVHIAWGALPLLVITTLFDWLRAHQFIDFTVTSGGRMWAMFSMIYVFLVCEIMPLRQLHPTPYFPVIANSLFYGTCLFLIRYLVINRTNQQLNRLQS